MSRERPTRRTASPGTRFGFGRNWKDFARSIGEDRVSEAMRTLQEMLATQSLAGRGFLDVGSGSGLFSLAAARLGAERVHSFDFDPDSVECTSDLKESFDPERTCWTIERESVLNRAYLEGLGEWDVVYSWGVLHHTGAMWEALGNVCDLVRRGGILFVAIYNDQGWRSKVWAGIKRFYNRGRLARALVLSVFVPFLAAGGLLRDFVRGRNPLARYRSGERGMAAVSDWIDWLGGYPFEVAKPEEIVEFLRARGFTLRRLKTVGGRMGCNEIVLDRVSTGGPAGSDVQGSAGGSADSPWTSALGTGATDTTASSTTRSERFGGGEAATRSARGGGPGAGSLGVRLGDTAESFVPGT